MNRISSSSLNLPQTQNTAPVLEFRCLFTPDLRRKQKRWQDGRLKYHTFNKRVMVYDERSNFVGDTHWKGTGFDEGEEFELERGNILVEVGECIGKRDQDLTELVDKRIKDKEDRAAARAALSPVRPQTGTPSNGLLRPKSLNAVIGTPTGHYGRAMVSNNSPFEVKQKDQDENMARPTKRRKQDDPTSSKQGYAQNLMGATLNFTSSKPPSTATIRYEPFKATLQRQTDMIDLTNDGNEVETPFRRSPPRIQKKKPRRSPPVKSGYASSLLGAALHLSRPDDIMAKTDSIIARKKVLAQKNNYNFLDLSCSEVSEDEGLVPSVPSVGKVVLRVGREGTSLPTLQISRSIASIPKPRRSTGHEESNTNSSSDERESSMRRSKEHRMAREPQRPKVVSPILKPRRMPEQEESMLDTSFNENEPPVGQDAPRSTGTRTLKAVPPIPKSQHVKEHEPSTRLSDRPISTLKIKARAPRRMMMLMDLPSSRSTSFNDSFERAESIQSQTKTPIRKEVNQSPNVMKTKSPFQNAERPTINPENMSSSPIDSGIDHQTIDFLLCRRRSSSEIGQSSNHESEKNMDVQPVIIQPIIEAPTTADEAVIEEEDATHNLIVAIKSPTALSEEKQLEEANDNLNTSLPLKTFSCKGVQLNPQATTNTGGNVPKIINPATRGQSVQMLATKTLDSLVAPVMLPPPPRTIDRPGIDLGRSRAAESPQLAGQAEKDGPWSRESFDLFGTWRPPERKAMTG